MNVTERYKIFSDSLLFSLEDTKLSEKEINLYSECFKLVLAKMEKTVNSVFTVFMNEDELYERLKRFDVLPKRTERQLMFERIRWRNRNIGSGINEIDKILDFCGIGGECKETEDCLNIYAYCLMAVRKEEAKRELENMLPLGIKFEVYFEGGEWGYRDTSGLSFQELENKNLDWEEIENEIYTVREE